jgi:hypothetical protein
MNQAKKLTDKLKRKLEALVATSIDVGIPKEETAQDEDGEVFIFS